MVPVMDKATYTVTARIGGFAALLGVVFAGAALAGDAIDPEPERASASSGGHEGGHAGESSPVTACGSSSPTPSCAAAGGRRCASRSSTRPVRRCATSTSRTSAACT
jgi:hypothetical protein